MTALIHAVKDGHLEVVNCLIERGADMIDDVSYSYDCSANYCAFYIL